MAAHTPTDQRPVAVGALAADGRAPDVVTATLTVAAAHGLRAAFAHVTGHYLAHPIRWTVGTPYAEPKSRPLSERDAEDAFAGWRRAAALFEQAGVPEGTEAHIVGGDPPAQEIRDLVHRLPAALLVIGRGAPRGRLRRMAAGSVSYSLVRRPPCPVLIVGPEHELVPNGPVVCGVAQASSTAQAAADMAAALARRPARPLVLAHVTDTPPASATGDDLVTASETWLTALGPNGGHDHPDPEREVLHGTVADALAAYAERREASILTVGASSRHALTTLLRGCVPVDLLTRSASPLLIVPPTSVRAGQAGAGTRAGS